VPDAEGAPASRRRAVTLGAVAITAASLGLAALLVTWDDLVSSGPGSSLQPGPGRLLSGEAEGWVKGVAPSTNTIRVSSGFLGLSSVTLVVTADTLIMVDGKEGAFDDIHEGRRVRAPYEPYRDGLRAKSIEVLVGAARTENRRAVASPGPNATLPARAVVRPLMDDGGPRRDGSEGQRVGALPSMQGRTQRGNVDMEDPTSLPKPPAAVTVPGPPPAPVVSRGSGAHPSPRRPTVSEPPPGERRSAAPARND
jgi:hypothetical protein